MAIKKSIINNEKFEISAKPSDNPELYIKEVIEPFIPQIKSQNLKVSIVRRDSFKLKIELDWRLY